MSLNSFLLNRFTCLVRLSGNLKRSGVIIGKDNDKYFILLLSDISDPRVHVFMHETSTPPQVQLISTLASKKFLVLATITIEQPYASIGDFLHCNWKSEYPEKNIDNTFYILGCIQREAPHLIKRDITPLPFVAEARCDDKKKLHVTKIDIDLSETAIWNDKFYVFMEGAFVFDEKGCAIGVVINGNADKTLGVHFFKKNTIQDLEKRFYSHTLFQEAFEKVLLKNEVLNHHKKFLKLISNTKIELEELQDSPILTKLYFGFKYQQSEFIKALGRFLADSYMREYDCFMKAIRAVNEDLRTKFRYQANDNQFLTEKAIVFMYLSWLQHEYTPFLEVEANPQPTKTSLKRLLNLLESDIVRQKTPKTLQTQTLQDMLNHLLSNLDSPKTNVIMDRFLTHVKEHLNSRSVLLLLSLRNTTDKIDYFLEFIQERIDENQHLIDSIKMEIQFTNFPYIYSETDKRELWEAIQKLMAIDGFRKKMNDKKQNQPLQNLFVSVFFYETAHYLQKNYPFLLENPNIY